MQVRESRTRTRAGETARNRTRGDSPSVSLPGLLRLQSAAPGSGRGGCGGEEGRLGGPGKMRKK
uniref:Uncharacterized protein n=1 Tax=Setaria italica TaxID=4555 RepID=K3XUL6_SETIT